MNAVKLSTGPWGASAAEECSDVAGVVQLPGVRTPEQLVALGQQCVRDCRVLLEAEERREGTGRTEADAKRAVQALDAVSNALCKVADAAELLR